MKETVKNLTYLLRECETHAHCSECRLSDYCHQDSFDTPTERAIQCMNKMLAEIDALKEQNESIRQNSVSIKTVEVLLHA